MNTYPYTLLQERRYLPCILSCIPLYLNTSQLNPFLEGLFASFPQSRLFPSPSEDEDGNLIYKNRVFLGNLGTVLKKGGNGKDGPCFLYLITKNLQVSIGSTNTTSKNRQNKEELRYFVHCLKKVRKILLNLDVSSIAIQEEYTPLWEHQERILLEFEEVTKIEVSIYKPLSFDELKAIF